MRPATGQVSRLSLISGSYGGQRRPILSKLASILLAAVLACFSVIVFAQPTVVEPVKQETLFVKGVGGYNIYRIPALFTTQKGTLLAFCEAREGGDSSDIDLLLRRSEDGGETWSRKQVVWNQNNNVCGKTWKYSQPIGPGCNESQVVELARGGREQIHMGNVG